MSGIVTFIIILAIIGYFAPDKKAEYEKFLKDNNITVTKESKPFQDGKRIIFDQNKRMLWIYKPLAAKQIGVPINLITGCELNIDGETNFSTSITSTAGRAVLGGMIAGGVGAIIGGATGRKKGISVVKHMQLSISTLDLQNPYIKIVIIQNSNGVERESSGYRKKYDNAMYWCKFIEALPHL
ncbi:hypothetical protein [Neobacillus sp. Marseille-QA0830]